MGCGSSRVQPSMHFRVREDALGQGEDAAASFRSMGLDEWTVDSLYSAFFKMDVSRTGKADLDCWYRYFGFSQTSFHDRCFGLFDTGGDGFITFDEFVRSTVDLCSMDHKSLLKFAFMMFDEDGNGVMAKSELVEMVSEMYGPNWDRNARVAAMVHSTGNADANGDGVLSFEEFCNMDKMFPSLLMPAFTMQNRVREIVLGLPFWEQAWRDRLKKGPGYSAFDILTAVQQSRRDAILAAAAGRAVAEGASTGERYVPSYLKGQVYVPETSLNPRAKAEKRRSQVEADFAVNKLKDMEKAAAFQAEVKRIEDMENAAKEELAEIQALSALGNGEGQPIDEDDSGLAAGKKGRRASARRASAVAAAAVRRESQLGIPSGAHANIRSRRRSSVANAAGRAAAMAMNE